MAEDELTCFVITPIGPDDSDTRRRADDVLDFIIEPAAESLGFRVERADHIAEPGRITRQIVERLISATVVIADLAGTNPNVFYELGIRHALQKWTIHLFEDVSEIPFDIHDYRAIKIGTGARAAAEAQNELRRALQHIKDRPTESVKTPFTEGIELELTSAAIAGGEASTEQRILGELTELRDEIRQANAAIPARRPRPARHFRDAQKLANWMSDAAHNANVRWRFDGFEDDGNARFRGEAPTGDVTNAVLLSDAVVEMQQLPDVPSRSIARPFAMMLRRLSNGE